MPGRHVRLVGRWRLHSIAAAAVLALAAALFATPAGAANTVVVTMWLTGASSSNCGALSTGGSDVYVAPGENLAFRTALTDVNLLPLSSVTDLSGELDIAGRSPTTIDTTSKVVMSAPLTAGDYGYTFTIKTATVKLLTGSTTVPLTGTYAGVTLVYKGTIHVTTDAAHCGVAVQVPGPSVSASLPGLPPVQVSVPPVTGPTVPLPIYIGVPASSSNAAASTTTSASSTTTAPAALLPGLISGTTRSSGGFLRVTADPNNPASLLSGLVSLAAATTSPDAINHPRGSGHDDLATDTPAVPTGPMLLAILAILALASVTGAAARFYLLRRNAEELGS